MTGINNFSDELNPFHIFSDSGIYNVKLIYYHSCISDTISRKIEIHKTIADAGTDSSLCYGESKKLTAIGLGIYLWNTGETTDTITANPTITATYTVTVTDTANSCANTDSVVITVKDPVAPAITNRINYTTNISADVYVEFNKLANATLEYGNTSAMSLGTINNNSLVFNVSFNLTGLDIATLYYYNMKMFPEYEKRHLSYQILHFQHQVLLMRCMQK